MIHHFLEHSARRFPDKVAVIHGDVRATYAEINGAANTLAQWLMDQGIQRGDRVALFLDNCLEYVVSYYGILKAGAVSAPLSSDLKPDGLRPLLEELKPQALIASSRFEKVLRATDLAAVGVPRLILTQPQGEWAGSGVSVFSWADLIHEGNPANPDIPMEASALACIVYTSGSTGAPKGVMLSHHNVTTNVSAICEYLNLTENDTQMVVLPFTYVMGKSLLNTHVAVAGTVVINNTFAYPASVIKQMAEAEVTGFSGVPATYAYLLHRSPLAAYRDRLHTLRYCSQAGGHMSPRLKQDLRQALPGHTKIYIMYGATEASARLTYLDPDQLEARPDSIGRPIPHVTLRVLDEKGEEVPVGQTGELAASGPNIMQGYWQDEEGTANVLHDNAYHTGDLGYQDEDGYFYVTGRKDHLLKVGGRRINPQEIEDVLMDTGLVLEAAVLGVPDDLLGTRLAAVVAPKAADCSADQILSSCSERLPRFKLPHIALVRSLPKSPSHKIDRRRCRELMEGWGRAGKNGRMEGWKTGKLE